MLVEKAIEFRMLDLHLDRLADIAGAQPEPKAPLRQYRPKAVRGEIEVRDLAFRYVADEPYIFENVSFKVAAGD